MKAASIRMICFPLVLAIALCAAGHTQTILTLLLEDLSRYFGAAARLTANAVVGIDKVEAAQIPSTDRRQAGEELRRISLDLSMLRAQQTPLVSDLTQYVSDVRTHGFDSQRQGREW